MSISLELSTIQYNSLQSAIINAQIDEYLRKGGVIQRLEIVRHALPSFNSEGMAPSTKFSKAVNIQKSAKAAEFERAIAEKLRAYVDLGIAAAAKDLGLGTRRLNFIASNYGIVFNSQGHSSALAVKRQKEAELAPQVRQAFADGANQQQVLRRFELTKDRLYRMAKAHNITLPGAVDEVADRKMIERITAIRNLGLPRTTCAKHLSISQKKLWRIVDMYGVDYPLIER